MNNMINDKKFFTKIVIYNCIFILFTILYFVFLDRLTIFSHVLSSKKALDSLGLIIFSIVLFVGLIYHLVILVLYILELKGKLVEGFTKKIDKKCDMGAFVVKCIVLIMFFMIFIITPCTVVGSSMDPTFKNGNRLVAIDLFINPKKNDIVVFDARKYTHDESFYIKRVVAAYKDVISYNDGHIYVNDEDMGILEESQYNEILTRAGQTDLTSSFMIPKNKLLVLGDNRDHSVDSGEFGLISTKSVFGKVFFSISPMKKI